MASSGIKIESGIQLLTRLTKKSDIKYYYPIIFGNGPNPGEIVEIYSEGTTNCLLIELICEALIPTELNGPETSVLIFNTDGNFCFTSFLNLLRNKIIKRRNYTMKSAEDVNPMLHSILKNVYILEIFDATQLNISIQNLEYYLAKHHNISLVVFHTLTAFYWSEQDFKIIKMDLYLKKLLHNIQKVIKDHKITVLYTRPEHFSSKDRIDNLEPQYQNITENLINYRIQIVCNNNSSYLINVRNNNNQFQREFNLSNNEISWL